MVFAFQKLQERQGKDTVFSIRGQKRSRHDVEQYWKRKRPNPADFSPIPDTPGGVTYRTPSPCPDEDASGGETEHTVEESVRSTFVECSNPDLTQKNSQLWLVTSPPTSIRLLNSPGSLRLQDQAIHYARVYFQSCAENIPRDENLGTWQEQITTVSECREKLLNLLAAVEYRRSQVTIESARLDMIGTLPKLAKIQCLPLMATLLIMVVQCSKMGQGTVPDWGTALSRAIMRAVAKLHVQGRSLLMALQAASPSFSVAIELSHRLFMAGKDILARRLGEQHNETCHLRSVMVEANAALADWHAALRWSEDLFRTGLWKFRMGTSVDNLLFLLQAKIHLARCHTELGNFGAAQNLIDEGLRICTQGEPSGWRDEQHSKLLLAQVFVELRQGRLGTAGDALTKLLAMRLRSHGAGDGLAAIAADWLSRILEDQTMKVHVSGDEEARFYPQGQENVLTIEDEDDTGNDDESHRVVEYETIWEDGSGLPTKEATAGMIIEEDGNSAAGVGNTGAAGLMAEVREEPWFIPQGQGNMWSDAHAMEWAQQGGQSHTTDGTYYFDTLGTDGTGYFGPL
ncbi:hypothetical protein CLCR_02878 [Cladophialophora carrionii]|uniref:Uncharacterized protein n=1 Tax=Cladophialophora carrionii TaxID=86049 RepID=A0A1C1D212_9EURO|nr:hypothetical protein CLCR_02878 [Cladophialophora carrionii]